MGGGEVDEEGKGRPEESRREVVRRRGSRKIRGDDAGG